MGSSCSRVGRLGFSNNSSSSCSFPQVCENSDSSDVYCRENVVPVDIEDGSSDFDLQSPFTSSNTQTIVSNESNIDEMSNFSNGNGDRNAEAYSQFVFSESDQSITDGPALSNSLHSINSSHYVHDLDSEFEGIVQTNSDVESRSLEQDLGSGLHIDMVSISSNNSLTGNIREAGTRELRSRGRRSVWDVFSRQNLTRQLMMFAIDDVDEGVNGRLILDTAAHDWGSRSNNRMGQRQSGFERLESVHHGSVVEDQRRRLCASGLHQDGTCSCDSQFPGDEFGALVRISRIVILVEAINELLDEIHRQTTPFSLSTLSVPARESIVNSLPLKSHKKLDMTDSSEQAQQCYICLAEYEEGDKIRVLPCKHEYHMPCVDKWLKQVHGICPLCRADVSSGSHSQSTDTES